LISRRLNDIIPTAPSRLVPQAASASFVQQKIADRRRKAKAQYDKRASASLRKFPKGEKAYVKPRPSNKQQPWIFGEVIGKPEPRACLVITPIGPVRRNHAQIREAKVEPPDSCDRFETASTSSESEPTEPNGSDNAHDTNGIRTHTTDRTYRVSTLNKRKETSCKV